MPGVQLCLEDIADKLLLQNGMVLRLACPKKGPHIHIAIADDGQSLKLTEGTGVVSCFDCDFELGRASRRRNTSDVRRCDLRHACERVSYKYAHVSKRGDS